MCTPRIEGCCDWIVIDNQIQCVNSVKHRSLSPLGFSYRDSVGSFDILIYSAQVSTQNE